MKQIWKELAQGDRWVWGSCLIMGLGCLKRRQIIKGLLYLMAELLFFLFFFGYFYRTIARSISVDIPLAFLF